MSPSVLFSCSLFLVFIQSAAPEFIDQGSETKFICESQKDADGMMFEPILRRNDDHHRADPVNLFVGSSRRPLVDNDWQVNKTTNATTKIDTFTYSLTNVDFEDAGIYVCDDIVQKKRNLTVVGSEVTCKEGEIKTQQGDMIATSCELPIDGPDPVKLAWYLGEEEQNWKLKEVKPEDTSITSMFEFVAQPNHHDQKLQCRYFADEKVKFSCEVSLEVTYPVQIKGKSKSVLHDGGVESEIHVIGNPWPGKKSLKVVSDDIEESKTTLDELDSGLGAEVTVFVPMSVFDKKKKANVIIKNLQDDLIGTVDIEIPENEASTKYIVVIVVLAIAAILLTVGVCYFMKKNKQKKAQEKESKGTPLAEQAA